MGRNAVGFYWTLPVPWAGFRTIPDNIDEAAKVSRTIRYQREAIRQHAQEHRYRLMHEEVFIEIDPDRGSEWILEPLEKVATICRANEAILLFVDFSEVQLWRRHERLVRWINEARIQVQLVFPGEILIDGYYFDPHAHFQSWRDRQRNWTASKPERAAKALARARDLREQEMSYREIAVALNAERLLSLSGKPWTTDNVRKLLDLGE